MSQTQFSPPTQKPDWCYRQVRMSATEGWEWLRAYTNTGDIYPTLDTSLHRPVLEYPPLLYAVLAKTMSTRVESSQLGNALLEKVGLRAEQLCTPGWGQALKEELGLPVKEKWRDLVVQRLKFCAPIQEAGSISGWGTRSCMPCGQENKRSFTATKEKELSKHLFERSVLRMERNGILGC